MKAKLPNKTQRFDYSSLSVRPPKIADAYGHGDGHWIPAELIIGNIDDYGYLKATVDEIAAANNLPAE